MTKFCPMQINNEVEGDPGAISQIIFNFAVTASAE